MLPSHPFDLDELEFTWFEIQDAKNKIHQIYSNQLPFILKLIKNISICKVETFSKCSIVSL